MRLAPPLAMTRTGTGDPVVLVHGIGHRRQAWDPVLSKVATERDVIAIDLPGFGESPALPDGVPYDMDTTMEHFAATFEELGLDRPHVVGNSLGGAIAIELGARDLVRSVTALSPAGFWTPAQRRYALTVLASMRTSTRVGERALARIARSPRLRARALAPLFAHPERVGAEQFLADARAMRDAPAYAPTAAAGTGYECRARPVVHTTIAWGTRDRILLPREAAIARRRLPEARHVMLSGCGHVPMIDDPDLVTQVILEGTDPARG